MDGSEAITVQFDQQTTSPLIGMQIITGNGELFNHVDGNQPMWSGEGDREVSIRVMFAAPFQKPPHISLGISGIDSSKGQNLRFDISPVDVEEDGFSIRFKTWDDTKIARASVSWNAIGAGIPIQNMLPKRGRK